MARRKKTQQKIDSGPGELSGFKVGDTIWSRHVSGKEYQGEIVRFYPDVPEGPCASIITQSSGYRTVLLSQSSFSKADLKKVK